MFIVLPDPSFMMDAAAPLSHVVSRLACGQGLVSVGALVPKQTWGQMLTSSQPLEAIDIYLGITPLGIYLPILVFGVPTYNR